MSDYYKLLKIDGTISALLALVSYAFSHFSIFLIYDLTINQKILMYEL